MTQGSSELGARASEENAGLCCYAKILTHTTSWRTARKLLYLGVCSFDAVGEISILYWFEHHWRGVISTSVLVLFGSSIFL